MKKVFYSFLAAAMFAGVVSCANEEAAPVEEVAVETTEEVPVEEAVVTEEVVVDSAAAAVEAPVAQ